MGGLDGVLGLMNGTNEDGQDISAGGGRPDGQFGVLDGKFKSLDITKAGQEEQGLLRIK